MTQAGEVIKRDIDFITMLEEKGRYHAQQAASERVSQEEIARRLQENEEMERKRIEAARQERINKALEAFTASAGKRFQSVTLDGFEIYGQKQERQRQTLEYCKRYAETPETVIQTGTSLTVVGPPGTGKSHLVYAIAKEFIKAGIDVRVQSFIRLAREIKQIWTDGGSEQLIIDKYAQCEFLILEEIGVQYESKAEKIFLFEILNSRYNNYRPFILTSNLAKEELKNYIDMDGYGRLWDRLQEVSRLVVCDWESYRERK